MKIIIQKVKEASVTVDNRVVSKINRGYVLLVGFTHDDDFETINKIAKKIISLRIFEDENDKLNYDIIKVGGSILSISQFTLYSKLNGRRPSFTDAMEYNKAKELYELFNEELKKYNIDVLTGIFGADMNVSLINEGPVTIIIDSKVDL